MFRFMGELELVDVVVLVLVIAGCEAQLLNRTASAVKVRTKSKLSFDMPRVLAVAMPTLFSREAATTRAGSVPKSRQPGSNFGTGAVCRVSNCFSIVIAEIFPRPLKFSRFRQIVLAGWKPSYRLISRGPCFGKSRVA